MHPIAEAQKDFQGGLGFDDNPYPKGSSDYRMYQVKMSELLTQELKDLRAVEHLTIGA